MLTTEQILDIIVKEIDYNEDTLGWKMTGHGASQSNVNLDFASDNIPRTELVTARLIADSLRNHLSYVPAENVWYAWNGRVHQPMTGDTLIFKLINVTYDGVVEALYRVEKKIESNISVEVDTKKKAEMKKALNARFLRHKAFRDQLATNRAQNAIVAHLKRLLDVGDTHFLDDRRWFVVENGVFDMDDVRATKQFKLLPHDASRPVYRMLNVRDEPGADYPALKTFLRGSIADSSQSVFFTKAVAVALMGAPEKTKTIVSIQGKTNSGKSMILDAIEKLCEGNSFYATPTNDAISRYGNNKDRARYPMRNARVVAFTEVREKLDETFILKYTGGDRFAVEEKYVAGLQVKPQGIIFVANNTPLNVDKSDPAMYSRVAPITFPWTFSKADPEHYEDETLGPRMVEEGSGFLEWLKWGYIQYLEYGLDKSDSMELTKRDEVTESSSVADFLESRMESGRYEVDPMWPLYKCITLTELHEDYVMYCRSHNVKEISSKTDMKKYLEDENWDIKRSNGTRISKLRLKTPF